MPFRSLLCFVIMERPRGEAVPQSGTAAGVEKPAVKYGGSEPDH